MFCSQVAVDGLWYLPGNWMGIRFIMGGNWMPTNLHYEITDSWRVSQPVSCMLTVPLRVLADTGQPLRVWTGFQPCMVRVMRERVLPSHCHFWTQSPHLSSPLSIMKVFYSFVFEVCCFAFFISIKNEGP